MKQFVDFVTPVGRLVQGSLYDPQTTNYDGEPLVYKTGPKKGLPRPNYYLGLALKKGSETHWNQTEWGAKIYAMGQTSHPQAYNMPTFAWKIVDGDCQIPNIKNQRKPCDNAGFPGHWVLKYGGDTAPQIVNADGSAHLTERYHVKLGYYVQIYGNVTGNGKPSNPGVFLNHKIVAFSAFGEEIIIAPDPKSVGFGNCPLPPGASTTPSAQFSAAAPTEVTPHTAILTPPVPPVPAAKTHKMTAAAKGSSYEEMREAGWTDELLIAHKMMEP